MTAESDAGAAIGTTTVAGDAEAQVMAEYGIVRTQVAYFHVGPYRYTSLGDAVAAARRQGEKK